MLVSKVVLAHGALLLATTTFSAWNVLVSDFNADGVNMMILISMKDGIAFVALSLVRLFQLPVVRLCGASRDSTSCEEVAGSPQGCRDWFLLGVVGLSAPFYASFATILCAQWAGSDTVGIFNAMIPVASALLAIGVGLERPSWLLFTGLALGTLGGVLMCRTPCSSEVHHSLFIFGTVIGITMTLAAGLFLVAMKPLLADTPRRKGMQALDVIRISYGFAAAASICSTAVAVCLRGFDDAFSAWGAKETLTGVYAGCVTGALNYFLLSWANGVLPVTLSALYGALQAPLTAVFSYVVTGAALTSTGYASMVLVTVSVIIVSWERTSDQKQGPLLLSDDSNFMCAGCHERQSE